VQHTFRVFEKITFNNIFAPRRDKVAGELRKEELTDLYSSLNIIQVIK
jgi:hypothetical protein